MNIKHRYVTFLFFNLSECFMSGVREEDIWRAFLRADRTNMEVCVGAQLT
jgi:hypothetical protein